MFDLRSEGVFIHQANPIQSNLSKLISDENQTRLFAFAPNETYIKVLEPNTLKDLYSIKLKKEISQFDISHDLNRFAVGFTSGEISIRSKNILYDEDNDIYKDQEEKDLELLE
jgi:hypothetical protein